VMGGGDEGDVVGDGRMRWSDGVEGRMREE
jgi:hypothetical protein